MTTSLISFIFKFRFSIAIVILTSLCIWTKSYYNGKYEDEVSKFEKYKTEQLEKYTSDLAAAKLAQEKLQEAHNKELEKYKVKDEILTAQYNSNKSQLDSLRKLLNQNSNANTNNTVTPESIANYSNTLSDLFGTCSGLLTEFAAEADRAILIASTHQEMNNQYREIIQEYNEKVKQSD